MFTLSDVILFYFLFFIQCLYTLTPYGAIPIYIFCIHIRIRNKLIFENPCSRTRPRNIRGRRLIVSLRQFSLQAKITTFNSFHVHYIVYNMYNVLLMDAFIIILYIYICERTLRVEYNRISFFFFFMLFLIFLKCV